MECIYVYVYLPWTGANGEHLHLMTVYDRSIDLGENWENWEKLLPSVGLQMLFLESGEVPDTETEVTKQGFKKDLLEEQRGRFLESQEALGKWEKEMGMLL